MQEIDHDTPTMLPFPAGASPTGRPSWSGWLQFSLVGIPLKAFPAVRNREVPTAHFLHADCGQRLRYDKRCPVHGSVDSSEVVKGYEYGPSQHVIVQPEELDPLRPAQDRALHLERFPNPGQLDPVLFSGRSLYLLPDGPAAEPAYAVLAAALVQRRRWALGRMVLGGHRQVVLVRPAGSVLLLQVLHYAEQVRPCPLPALPQPIATSEEMRLAGMLIEAGSGTVDWSIYRDQAAQELKALLDAKLKGTGIAAIEPERPIVPLLEALQRSVAVAAKAKEGTKASGKEPKPAAHQTRCMMLPTLLPMLAVSSLPFDSEEYSFEVKWDGVRALAAVEARSWRLWGRGRADYTARYPELELLRALPSGTMVDGELVALGAGGMPDLARLLRRHAFTVGWKIGQARRWCPVHYVLFDLLYHRGRSLLEEPLVRRRELLAQVCAELRRPEIVYSPGIVGRGHSLYAAALAQGHEGVMAKQLRSAYRPGRRSATWCKIKPKSAAS